LDEENPTFAGLAGLAPENGFVFCLIVHVALAGKRPSSAVHLQKRV
jgi:hypothetical protein